MGKERQARRQEEIRNVILEAAKHIIAREGVPGLSIRKITSAIDYSPAIIYHYFKDKTEIIETLVGEGYRQIIASVMAVEKNDREPEKEIREVFTRYIKSALASPEYYRQVMLNDDPAVLRRTGLLQEGISKARPTMERLCENLQRGVNLGRYQSFETEPMAQVIWTATFGLIIKLIIEKDVSPEQVDRLIENHFKLLFNGI